MKKILLATSIFFLISGCSGNKLATEAISSKEKSEKIIDHTSTINKDESPTYYETNNLSKEEIKHEIPKENKMMLEMNKEVFQTQEFNDPNELAKYLGQKLFEFYNLDFTPEQYLDLIESTGSKSFKDEMLANREESLMILASVQRLLRDKGLKGEDFILTTVTINAREGYFYRKIIYPNSQEGFYITTLKLEEGVWKFHEDSPSPPFQLTEMANE